MDLIKIDKVKRLRKKMENYLKSIDLPKTSVSVCGNVVGIECLGEETAKKWHSILSHICESRITKVSRRNKMNTNTVLLPDTHFAYVVGGFLKSFEK